MWNEQILTIKLIEEKQKWENPSHNLILAQKAIAIDKMNLIT